MAPTPDSHPTDAEVTSCRAIGAEGLFEHNIEPAGGRSAFEARWSYGSATRRHGSSGAWLSSAFDHMACGFRTQSRRSSVPTQRVHTERPFVRPAKLRTQSVRQSSTSVRLQAFDRKPFSKKHGRSDAMGAIFLFSNREKGWGENVAFAPLSFFFASKGP